LTKIKEHIRQYNPAFWLQSIAVFAFGASWLMKDDTILADHEKDRKLDERNLEKAAAR
jgi:hypothetical protein